MWHAPEYWVRAQDQHLGGWKDGVESEIISAFGANLPSMTT
jgi:hypothetical protein